MLQFALLHMILLGVANHHPEKKKLLTKFFAQQFFYPAGPIWAHTFRILKKTAH